MTHPQLLAFAVLAVMMAAFVWGRLRYDLVAVLALIAAILLGVVPHEAAFKGFGDDIVIIVASALIVSAAVERSGVIEAVLHRVSPNVTSVQAQIALLVVTVTVLSAFVKNIGALAMLMPAALQMARRSNKSPSSYLMPMAFGALLGGVVTLVGTSPNIIVSRMREELTGEPFQMFDFTPVGVGLAVAGVLFLVVAYRILPARSKNAATLDEALDLKEYMTEAKVMAGSAVLGKTVGDLITASGDEVLVLAVLRAGGERLSPLPDVVLRENDIVLLEGDPEALERAVKRARLQLEGEKRSVEGRKGAAKEIGGVEAVIGPGSILIGRTAKRLALHRRFDINLLAVNRSGERFTKRLRDIDLLAGDVVVLKGELAGMPDKLRHLGLLPLAAREIRLGNVRHGLTPIVILGAAMALTAFGVLPVATAFFCAAVAMVLFRSLSLREAYDAVDWSILVMLAALIPLSEAIRATGGADVVAGALYRMSSTLPAWEALTLIMASAMLVTPFLNNAATVLVMAPIAATFAEQFGYRADAFLMAVAVGAACDFLTPIGHQCNTLVMGPGGYRFGDYWKLGLPLTLIVLALGVPLILLVWPLA